VAASIAVLGLAAPAHADGVEAGGVDATAKCTTVLSASDLRAGLGDATTAASKEVIAVASAYKASHPLELAGKPTAADRAAVAAHDAQKAAWQRDRKGGDAACAGLSIQSSGQITWMYHYTQSTNYFCGPAVVSEFSATVPGSSPYNLNQYTVASYMGTTSNGTNYSQETNGLNHYVGVPDFGWNFYGMAWMSDPPTAAQQQAFINNLSADVAVSSPIAGLAYEVAGGPHLVGHPVNQTIGHWIEIGGYNTGTSQVWYADSAQNPWPNVPAYSWFDMWTMEVILGGAGYIW
jgi:hypothetical protein